MTKEDFFDYKAGAVPYFNATTDELKLEEIRKDFYAFYDEKYGQNKLDMPDFEVHLVVATKI